MSIETDAARKLPAPDGRNVSLAAITVAWCAAHPGRDFPATLPYVTAASDVRRKFPYSWGELMSCAEREKVTAKPCTYAQVGDRVRAEMIERGIWHPAEFEA